MTSTTERVGDRAVKEQSFCMLLMFSEYNYKLACYNFRALNVIPMVTTKNRSKYTEEKIKKESKCFAYKNLLNTKEDRKVP